MKPWMILAAACTALASPVNAAQTCPYESAVRALVEGVASHFSPAAVFDKEKNTQLAQKIGELLAAYDIDMETTGIALTTLDGTYSYYMNANKPFLAASLYKVPLALLYYDQIEAGEASLSDLLPYTESMYEPGSVVASRYAMGSKVPLKELLETVIVDSDNTSGHILFENLGGWLEYREQIEQYSQDHVWDEFVTMDNVLTCNYMNDVLLRIAQNQKTYQAISKDMLASQPQAYLNLFLDEPIPQKYGALGAQVNAAGFNLDCAHPYVLTIMSDDAAAEVFIGEVSLLIEQMLSGEEIQPAGEEEIEEAVLEIEQEEAEEAEYELIWSDEEEFD